MLNLSSYIYVLFILTTLSAIFIFYKAAGSTKKVFGIIAAWMLLQSLVSSTGFYANTGSLPPRLLLLLMPPVAEIIFLFATVKGRAFLDSLDIKLLTLIHIVRVPVEVVLFCLFINKAIPQLMTFEGRNFDILSGLTAPFIYYAVFVKFNGSRKMLLLWNIVCLALLFSIVINAVLSVPYPFQQFAFDQPNIAILYFPFVWLPGIIVPLVLLSNLAAIRQLVWSGKINKSVSPV